MPYYMREVVNTCQHDGCTKDARFAVYGPRNDKFGVFCAAHARAKVTDLERYEQACDYAKEKETR